MWFEILILVTVKKIINKLAETLVCIHCVVDTFKVGRLAYSTAVKCVTCEYEVFVH